MPPEPLLPESEDVQAVQDDRPVYFRSIEVENVLCFKSRQTLDLTDANGYPAQWTVILGDNGVGKTTLLRSLASMEPIVMEYGDRRSIEPRRCNYKYSSIWKEIDMFQSRELFIKIKFAYKNSKNSIETSQLTVGPYGALIAQPYRNSSIETLKCYAYGASRRMGATSLVESLESDSTASLFSDNATLLNAEEWLLQADYSIALSARTGTVNPKLERRYQLIIEILKELLPDVEDVRIVMAGENRSGAIAEFSRLTVGCHCLAWGWAIGLSLLGQWIWRQECSIGILTATIHCLNPLLCWSMKLICIFIPNGNALL